MIQTLGVKLREVVIVLDDNTNFSPTTLAAIELIAGSWPRFSQASRLAGGAGFEYSTLECTCQQHMAFLRRPRNGTPGAFWGDWLRSLHWRDTPGACERFRRLLAHLGLMDWGEHLRTGGPEGPFSAYPRRRIRLISGRRHGSRLLRGASHRHLLPGDFCTHYSSSIS